MAASSGRLPRLDDRHEGATVLPPSAAGRETERPGGDLRRRDAEDLRQPICGWAQAHAHSKAGDPWTIAGYLGKGDEFDDAISKFAVSYADQAERDHGALKSAVRSGSVQVIADR